MSPAQARDWIHWRGPEQNGVSREKGLPDSFDPRAGQGERPLAAAVRRPVGAAGPRRPAVHHPGHRRGLHEGEQVVCFDEKTGKKLWEYRVNVFHTDIVSSRLGWTTLTADPDTKNVYAHTTAGLVLCLSRDGKLRGSGA